MEVSKSAYNEAIKFLDAPENKNDPDYNQIKVLSNQYYYGIAAKQELAALLARKFNQKYF